MKRIEEFIKNELRDLDIPSTSRAYQLIFENAKEGAEIMSTTELKHYIEEYADSLPNSLFYGGK